MTGRSSSSRLISRGSRSVVEGALLSGASATPASGATATCSVGRAVNDRVDCRSDLYAECICECLSVSGSAVLCEVSGASVVSSVAVPASASSMNLKMTGSVAAVSVSVSVHLHTKCAIRAL